MSAEATVEVHYDPYDPQMLLDPWETFRQLRDHAPVYHVEGHDMWVLSRFEDIREAAKDHVRFSSAQGVTTLIHPDTGEATPTPIGPGDFLEMDPPEHDQLRAVIRHRFAPAALKDLEPFIRQVATELLDAFIADGSADLAKDYGCQIPVRVITRMLGLSQEDCPKLSKWLHLATGMPAPGQSQDEWAKGVMEGAGAMWVHLAAALADRAENPRDDILTDLATARIDGEPLGDVAVGMCFLLYGAGEDTTVGLITNMIRQLAASPDHRRHLVEDRSRIAGAIDEHLRWDGPFLHLTRTTTEDVELHGTTIPSGSRVILLWASGNRDERQFEQPDTLDFERKRVAHLGFGHGIHHCIGHALAKLEARIALDLLLQRIPDFEIPEPVWNTNKPFIRALSSLPATFPAGGGEAA